LMTSFAGGASGYPLCFDIYPLAEKRAISQRARHTHMAMVTHYARATTPRVYMPYAGFFEEAAPRDRFIRNNNQKNSIEETLSAVSAASPRTMVINPLETEAITITASEVKPKAIGLARLYAVDTAYVTSYIQRHRIAFPALLPSKIIEFFEGSAFRDDLCLIVIPSGDDFRPLGASVRVDFSHECPRAVELSADEALRLYDDWPSKGGKRIECICVRAESLSQVISNRMPFEDLLIGFQCRVKRKPDIYNSDFWYHFSSVYVGQEHLRGSERCDGCARIIHGINRALER